MFVVKTYLAKSSIHGIGVFLSEAVMKGQTVWEFDPRFDLMFSVDQFSMMTEVERDLLISYGYIDKQQFNGWWILPCGNDRFTNHSTCPNTIPFKISDCQFRMVAASFLDVGTEITCDYSIYDYNFGKP